MGSLISKSLILSTVCVLFGTPNVAFADGVQDAQSARARSYDLFYQAVYKNPSITPDALHSAYQAHVVQPNTQVQSAIQNKNQEFISKQPRLREASAKERSEHREQVYAASKPSNDSEQLKEKSKNQDSTAANDSNTPQRKIASPSSSAPSSYNSNEAIHRDQQKVNVLSFEGTSKKSQ